MLLLILMLLVNGILQHPAALIVNTYSIYTNIASVCFLTIEVGDGDIIQS